MTVSAQVGSVVTDRTPWWATPLGCTLVVLVLTLPRLAFAIRFGLIGDEAYYAIWSFYPGFGYFDHSPAVAWFIWLGRAIFGESEFAVRSLFVLASLLTAGALYRTGQLLGDRGIGAAAAIAYVVTIGALISFGVATPDGPSTLFWTLTIWAIAEFTSGRNANWWLAAGVFAGLGLLSKYTVVFLGAGILFYLLTSRERRQWLTLWQVWAGGVLALVMFSPVIWINSQRDWNSFRFQAGRSNFADHVLRLDEFLRFLIEEGIQLLPTLYIFVFIGIVLFFARRARPLALPLLTSAPMVAYFLADALFGRVNPNWTAPLFPQLALLAAFTLIVVRPKSRWLRWPLNTIAALHVPLGLGLVLVAYTAVELRALPGLGPLPFLNYVYGWGNLQHKVSDLARANGVQWVDTTDYSLNGWLGYYGRIAHDPLPVFQTGEPFRYAYMPPMDSALTTAPHLIIQGDGSPPAGASPLGPVTRDVDGQPVATYHAYLVQ